MKYHYVNTPKGKVLVPRDAFDFNDKGQPIRNLKMGGRTYIEMRDGSIVRTSPLRPWRGKSQRRAVIRSRRLARQSAYAS